MAQVKHPALRVGEELHDTLQAAQEGQWSVIVQPPENADGDLLDSAEQLWQSLHSDLDRVSFELHRTEEGAIKFHLVHDSREDARRTQRHVLSNYPRAGCEIERSSLPIEIGDAVAATRIEYEQDHLLPLLSGESKHAPDGDPARPIYETLANEHGRCVLQAVVEPIDHGWTTRHSRGTPLRREDHRWWRLPPDRLTRWDAIMEAAALTLFVGAGWWLIGQWFSGLSPGILTLFIGLGLLCCAFWWSTMFGHPFPPRRQTSGDVARHLRDKPWDDESERATRGERMAADLIDQQGRAKSFRVSMRLLSMGETAAEARKYLKSVGSQLSSAWHNRATTQQLTSVPVSRPQGRVRRFVERTGHRSREPARLRTAADKILCRSHRPAPMIMPDFELAGTLGHLPDSDSGGAGAIDYAPPRLRTKIPPAAPSYLRPGEEAGAIGTPRNSPLARAGRLMLERLPGPLADRLAERGVGINRDENGRTIVGVPEWVTSESDLNIDVDHRETAQHHRYGTVELKLIKEEDPSTHEDDGDVWMGSFLREIVESKQQLPRDDILIGFQEQGGQAREVSVDFDTVFTHIFIQGVTGGGKSTLAETILAQWMNSGFGLAIPDPSGELVQDVLRWLPEHRHDDVVWYAPEPDVAQKIVGFNPFEIAAEAGDQDYGGAVDDAVDRVENGLKAAEDGDQWGARMIGVCRNLARVMITSPEPFTLVDLHDALSSEEGREKLAERAGKSDEFVAKYTRKIAAFDDTELDSLLRRLNEWVESTVSRTTVAVRESSLDLDEIVRGGKILLFDNKLSNSALSRMLGTYVWSHIWDICEDRPKDEREPFMVLADEFDDLITPEMDVAEQLRNARKYELCLVLMTQYLDAIGNKEVERAIDEECATTITLPIKGEDASGIANRLGLEDESYLTQLARFHALVELEVDGKPRGPFEISIPGPVAPERTLAEARETIVEPALDRHGHEPLTDQEIYEQQILSEGGAPTSESTSAKRHATALKAAYVQSIRQGTPGGPILIDDVLDRVSEALGESFSDADAAWRSVFQSIPDTQVKTEKTDEGTEITILDTPWLNVGEGATAGGKGHLDLMEDAEVPLTQLGFTIDVLDQSDGAANESMPDAIARLEDVLDTSDLDPVQDRSEIISRVEEFRNSDENAVVHRLAGVRDAYIESECSTTDTQPSQAVRNAIAAANDGHRCLFLVRPGLGRKLHENLDHDPKGANSGDSTPSETRFYTRSGTPLTIDGEEMTRPGAKNNVWVREESSGQIVLRDTDGTEHARFDSPAEVFSNADAFPEEGNRNIMAPVIPAYELDSGTMEDIEWDILEVPYREDVDHEYDPEEDDEPRQLTPIEISLYRHHAENVPLIDLPVSEDETPENVQDQVEIVEEAIDNVAEDLFSND